LTRRGKKRRKKSFRWKGGLQFQTTNSVFNEGYYLRLRDFGCPQKLHRRNRRSYAR
jgi:hypothetical protein